MKKNYNYKSLDDIEPILGFNKFESALLIENGITTKEKLEWALPDIANPENLKIREFLWSHCNLKGIDEFINIMETKKDQTICVLADYDADGLMGASILRIGLENLGFKTFHVIPDRLLDGFAVKKQHIDKAIEGGASVIITVDNGSSAVEPVAYAKEKGLTVIVTDHHLAEGDLPPADLIINPHINGDEFEDICGAVVAMKIVAAYYKKAGIEARGLYEEILCMGAIATVGDMMPVVNENRLIIKLGFKAINRIKEENRFSTRIGKIIAGMSDTNYMAVYNCDKIITEETAAYYICPVLNATGRIEGDVNQIVDDIISCSLDNFYLQGYKEKNKLRKLRTREISGKHHKNNKSVDITILKEEDFDYPINGLIGLLANKISNSEHKPCFVGYIPKDGNICKLSGRTVNGYSIYDAFNKIKDAHPELNLEGGGHEGAVGIEMPISSIEKFEKLICEDYDNFEGATEIQSCYVVTPDQVDALIEAHNRFAPFGEGFKKLKLVTTGKIDVKNELVNMVGVNGFEFKVYTLLSNLPPEGTEVNLYFSISLGNRFLAELKMEEVEVVENA